MSITADASALRGLPLFERVSLRLLQDLVEYASLNRWRDDGADDARAAVQPMARRLGLLRRDLPGEVVSERDVRGRWLETALASSFSLAHAFAGRRRDLFEMLIGEHPAADGGTDDRPSRTHWLFLAKDPRFAQTGDARIDVDLVVTAGLLARSLDRNGADVGERAVVAVLERNGLSLHCWNGDRPLPSIPLPVASTSPRPPGEPDALYDRVHTLLCETLVLPDETIFHVVCVNPGHPSDVPAWWRQRFRPDFHRLVYLTRRGGSLRPPDELMALLRRGAWDPRRGDGPYFSSVVPTIVLPPKLESRSYNVLRAPWAEDLETLEVEPETEDRRFLDARAPAERRTSEQRLQRDLCRVRLDPGDLALCDRDPTVRRSLDRWARAVTNRQVGIALSGGGATSAALVPFIEALQGEGIPIDVVTGFSGGAILGVYLATGRLSSYFGFARGLLLTALMQIAIVFSKSIEMAIDWEFGSAHLEDLEVRFIPMTVELPTDGSPRACAVVAGTLGEGVRVSGVALGVFSPAERRGTRYVDAGTAMGVPAAALARYGADLTIACNSIVPPRGRLLSSILPSPLGQFLRLVPVTGAMVEYVTNRFADYWVGFLTMLREAARSGARDAHVYYEVWPDETPFLDAFNWLGRDRIRDVAAAGRRWQDELDRCVELWQQMRHPGGH